MYKPRKFLDYRFIAANSGAGEGNAQENITSVAAFRAFSEGFPFSDGVILYQSQKYHL